MMYVIGRLVISVTIFFLNVHEFPTYFTPRVNKIIEAI